MPLDFSYQGDDPFQFAAANPQENPFQYQAPKTSRLVAKVRNNLKIKSDRPSNKFKPLKSSIEKVKNVKKPLSLVASSCSERTENTADSNNNQKSSLLIKPSAKLTVNASVAKEIGKGNTCSAKNLIKTNDFADLFNPASALLLSRNKTKGQSDGITGQGLVDNIRKRSGEKASSADVTPPARKKVKVSQPNLEAVTVKAQPFQKPPTKPATKPRSVVLDGCNVAIPSCDRTSCFGKCICKKKATWDWKRLYNAVLKLCELGINIKKIAIIIQPMPQKRKEKAQNYDLYKHLEPLIHYSTKRNVSKGGAYINHSDDHFIIEYAASKNSVIVTNDQYRDHYKIAEIAKDTKRMQVLQTSVLNYSIINEVVIFPIDPLGADGPSLHDFLRH